MRGRFYSPAWHRFMNSNQGVDPNLVNQFAYTIGNPLMMTDPTGMDATSGFAGGFDHPNDNKKSIGRIIDDIWDFCSHWGEGSRDTAIGDAQQYQDETKNYRGPNQGNYRSKRLSDDYPHTSQDIDLALQAAYDQGQYEKEQRRKEEEGEKEKRDGGDKSEGRDTGPSGYRGRTEHEGRWYGRDVEY